MGKNDPLTPSFLDDLRDDDVVVAVFLFAVVGAEVGDGRTEKEPGNKTTNATNDVNTEFCSSTRESCARCHHCLHLFFLHLESGIIVAVQLGAVALDSTVLLHDCNLSVEKLVHFSCIPSILTPMTTNSHRRRDSIASHLTKILVILSLFAVTVTAFTAHSLPNSRYKTKLGTRIL